MDKMKGKGNCRTNLKVQQSKHRTDPSSYHLRI